MATKPCTECGEMPKMSGKHRCTECWLRRQPVEAQTTWAQRRLAAVPEALQRARVPERDWPAGRRWCSGCQAFVRLRDLSKDASRCRGCAGLATRSGYLERVYGITREQEQALWEAQGRRCALCGREVHSKRPAVDHDHATEEVRGLLCPGDRWCNNAIVGGIEAAAQNLPGGALEYAQRLVAYFTEPPARAVLQRMRDRP